MTVKGILWHSTGANNPNLKRYVQPSDNAVDKTKMLNLLGKNTNKNDIVINNAVVHLFSAPLNNVIIKIIIIFYFFPHWNLTLCK